jgi:manganese transport protein
MEGFLRFRIRPWLRRLMTRALAIVPAVAVILATGEKGVYQLLILSQVILSLQLSFAVVPLVRFTNSKQKMGPFVNPGWLQWLAWLVTLAIMALNAELVYEEVSGWIAAAGAWGWLVGLACVPISLALVSLLLWMIFRRERVRPAAVELSAEEMAARAARAPRQFRRIGVALDVQPTDTAMLAEAVALARTHHAELVLIHVVDGVGGTWYGDQTGDAESRGDEAYMKSLAERLRAELAGQSVPAVDAILGYGDAASEIVNITREKGIDLVVLGGHGHRGLLDLLHGATITGVRHDLKIPIVAVRGG